MKNKMQVLIMLILSVSLLAISGCSSVTETGKSQADQKKTEEKQKIVITEPARGELWAPIYLAETLGYFDEAGLDVEFQTVTGTDSGTPVIAGEAQFGFMGIEMPLGVTEAGQKVKVLISTTQKFPYCFMTQGESYLTVQSLKGKTIAVGTSRSGSPTAWVRTCLAHGGLDPDQDATLVGMKGPAVLTAMEANDIQACNGSGVIINKLVDKGGKILVDGRNSEVFKEIMGSETYEMYIMFATDKYIKENPETVQKVVTACAKGMQWLNSHSAEEAVDAMLPLFEGKRDDLLISLSDAKKLQLFSQDGKHSKSGFKAALKMAKDSGMITKDIPAEKIYDESFLDKAWAEIGK